MTTGATVRKPPFTVGEMIVYPAQGVGRVVAVETEEVAGHKLELFVMFFEREKLTLRVPISKAATSGMRKLSDPSIVEKALQVLTGRARVNRAMWSRRATEYQTKINSGDLLTVAEVVRDLFRAPNQPEASYSERGLYEAASMLLAREISAVKNITETEALKLIEQSQSKSAQQAAAVEPDDGAQAAA